MTGRRTSRPRRRSSSTAVKVVVTGPFAAGKTTFIRTISDITVLSTERDVTDETSARKSETTVAMDYGRISVDRELTLYLFGTPGQERFEFMWEILGQGMIGFVLLLDGTAESSFAEAATILTSFRATAPNVPYVVAVNQVSELDDALAERIRRRVGLRPDDALVPCSALERESVRDVILALLSAVLAAIDNAEGPGVSASAPAADAALVDASPRNPEPPAPEDAPTAAADPAAPSDPVSA